MSCVGETNFYAQEVAIKLGLPLLVAVPGVIASVLGMFTSKWLTVAGLASLLFSLTWAVNRLMIGEPPPDWKPEDPVVQVMRERGVTYNADEFRALTHAAAEQHGLTVKRAAHFVANGLVAPREGVRKAYPL